MKNNAVLLTDDSSLKGNERLIAFELSVHADRKSLVRMSQTEMATHTGLSRRTVASVYDSLQLKGLVERLGHGRYRITEDEFIDDSDVPTMKLAPGASEENERLVLIRKPDEGIRYNKDGWPVLVKDSVYED